MAYVKTVWVDDAPPAISAANLNKMEVGIEDAHAALDAGVPKTLIDAAGDLIVGTAPDTVARLAKGADGQVLMVAAGTVGWGAVSGAPAPATTLPAGSDGLQALLVDSLTTPTYAWLCQYEASITDAYKWIVLGAYPIAAEGLSNVATSGYTTVASVTTPRAGIYNVRGGIHAGNGAAASNPQLRIGGAVQRQVVPGGSQYSRLISLFYEKQHTIAAATAVDVQATANGSDATYAQGSVSINPLRIS